MVGFNGEKWYKVSLFSLWRSASIRRRIFKDSTVLVRIIHTLCANSTVGSDKFKILIYDETYPFDHKCWQISQHKAYKNDKQHFCQLFFLFLQTLWNASIATLSLQTFWHGADLQTKNEKKVIKISQDLHQKLFKLFFLSFLVVSNVKKLLSVYHANNLENTVIAAPHVIFFADNSRTRGRGFP